LEAKIASKCGGIIAAVEKGSPAHAAGLRAGDRLIAINGRLVRDVLDCQFYAEGKAILDIERSGQHLRVELEVDGAGLGLEFVAPTFDGLRRCVNRCPFCFLKGLPRRLRRSLYVKDDDYRYSFLFGNFITLTNLTEADWERLAEQRLSPLYVSVHATDLDLRRRLLGNPRAPDVLAQLRRLGELRIRVHTQVVLCPGVNDGPHLDRTIGDLAALYPTVASIGVVPVGLTAHHLTSSLPLRRFTEDEAKVVVAQLRRWQRRFRAQLGISLVYPSDEFYLLAGWPIPAASWYDGFPQYENGIGMVRVLLDDWYRARRRASRGLRGDLKGRVALVCGTLIAPLLAIVVEELDRLAGAEVELIPVTNRFFGETVTVSGLLTGRDVLEVLREWRTLDVLVLPRHMLDATGQRFLDDLTPDDLARALGVRIETAELLSDLLGGL